MLQSSLRHLSSEKSLLEPVTRLAVHPLSARHGTYLLPRSCGVCQTIGATRSSMPRSALPYTS